MYHVLRDEKTHPSGHTRAHRDHSFWLPRPRASTHVESMSATTASVACASSASRSASKESGCVDRARTNARRALRQSTQARMR